MDGGTDGGDQVEMAGIKPSAVRTSLVLARTMVVGLEAQAVGCDGQGRVALLHIEHSDGGSLMLLGQLIAEGHVGKTDVAQADAQRLATAGFLLAGGSALSVRLALERVDDELIVGYGIAMGLDEHSTDMVGLDTLHSDAQPLAIGSKGVEGGYGEPGRSAPHGEHGASLLVADLKAVECG